MSLPVIATNWSGNREFMNENNSYLVEVDHFEEVADHTGHLWAIPSVAHLKVYSCFHICFLTEFT